jgi:hypothetical protein
VKYAHRNALLATKQNETAPTGLGRLLHQEHAKGPHQVS